MWGLRQGPWPPRARPAAQGACRPPAGALGRWEGSSPSQGSLPVPSSVSPAFWVTLKLGTGVPQSPWEGCLNDPAGPPRVKDGGRGTGHRAPARGRPAPRVLRGRWAGCLATRPFRARLRGQGGAGAVPGSLSPPAVQGGGQEGLPLPQQASAPLFFQSFLCVLLS